MLYYGKMCLGSSISNIGFFFLMQYRGTLSTSNILTCQCMFSPLMEQNCDIRLNL